MKRPTGASVVSASRTPSSLTPSARRLWGDALASSRPFIPRATPPSPRL
jgi:hypothetical protein